VRALDISKRLIDYGYHPPTNYFPLIVHDALMIEPTETESKETMDAFADTLAKIAEDAVLNANYLLARLRGTYKVPYDRTCMHEFVVEGRWEDVPDVIALDISKRLMDYGVHPPTNYFPLIVHDALVIEPTETESKESLDAFVEILQTIAHEAHETPELLKEAPHITPVRRLDEVKAARDLVLCCWVTESDPA
jgi:glycine dehydrogenase subunit 2